MSASRQIVDALYGVKTLTAPVAVSNMHVTRRLQDPHTYDVEMTCIALAKGEVTARESRAST